MPTGDVEATVARLLDAYPAGIEERSLGDRVELAVYTDARGEAAFRELFPGAVSELVPGGWDDRWKAFHRPVRAAGLWIGPPWIEPPAGEPAVVVDPGRAFGTGAHPTTRASIELLARLERGSLFDAGCGSGVVSVAAVRLGYEPVEGVDLDPVAVEVARETAGANGVVAEFSVADVLSATLPAADVLVANIELPVVEALLGRTCARDVVTSGYLAPERPAAPGWEHSARLELEGWAADVWTGRH